MLRAAGFVVTAGLAALAFIRLASAAGQPSNLELRFGNETRTFSPANLLERDDVATLTVANDPSYKRPMTYRAVPLERLLAGLPYRRFDTLQAVAHDGFVAEIPASLLSVKSGATAWIAVDDPRQPWPNLPGKAYGAGPFYLVWENPDRSRIMSEQWVTELDRLAGAESPERRWPQLAVGATASDDARRGMAVFITQCLPCHQFNGAGASKLGPDLGRPMNAAAYMTEKGLHALIRDPRSVRSWPKMQMPGFGPQALSNADLDAILRYLQYKAALTTAGP
jgi:mono/diheme cytochrome c family protein